MYYSIYRFLKQKKVIMEQKFGFIRMNINEFETWILELKVARTVLTVQQHHTWRPSYKSFDGNNHFDLQKNMRDYHVHNNGWSDIGQHISVFPDGSILTGRSFERSPACIYGQNSNAFCIESIGNFDSGNDIMHDEQKKSIIRVTAVLCRKFGLEINTNSIVYHHWFRLSTGQRNNGNGGNKSCPGTSFFGGNKVENSEANFLPKVQVAYNQLVELTSNMPVLKFVCVNSEKLNVRVGSHYKKAIARSPLSRGVIIRVFEIADNGWFKISSKETHWVSGKFTHQVWKAHVVNNEAISRIGAGITFEASSVFLKNEELFVSEKQGNWYKINMTMEWLHEDDLSVQLK